VNTDSNSISPSAQNQLKTCSKCKIEQPRSEFSPNKRNKDGLGSHCKTCRRAYGAQYRQRPESAKYQYNYRRTEEYREKARSRYHNDEAYRQRKDELSRQRQQTPKYKTWHRQHRQSEAGRLARRANNQNRLARLNGSNGKVTQGDIQLMLRSQKGRCWYCQTKLDKYHIEHRAPLSRGGSNHPSNLVLSCPTCNLSKGAKFPHEWIGRLI
jgi:hypothetical protein